MRFGRASLKLWNQDLRNIGNENKSYRLSFADELGSAELGGGWFAADAQCHRAGFAAAYSSASANVKIGRFF